MTAFAPLAAIVTFVLALAAQDAKPGAKPAANPDAKADPKAVVGPDAQQTPTAEELTYAAFKLETEQRDLTRAVAAWKAAREAAAKEGDKSLEKKAMGGVSRCLLALGKRDEAIAEVERLIAANPNDKDWKAIRAELERMGQDEQDVTKEVRAQLDVVLTAPPEKGENPFVEAARNDVIRMGDAAVPELARRLSDVHSRVVADCARMLARIDTERSIAALADGIRDPEVAYPLILVNAPLDSRQPRNLPIARATFERPEKELHHAGALWMLDLRGSLPPAEAAEITAKLIQENDREVQETALSNCGDCDVAHLLIPTLEPFVHSDDEARQKAAVRFFAGNRTCIPADVADEWTRALAGSRHPSVRVAYWSTQIPTGRDNDENRMAECLLALLGDEDPAVFSAGAENLKNSAFAVSSLQKVGRDQHDAVFAATRRAVELAAVSARHRDLVLASVRVASLADEELLDLFLRLAQHPADLSASRRAVLRARFARELVERHVDSRAARDSFTAPLLSRIPDAAGRRMWLEITRNAGDGHWREEPSTELLAAAVADDDRPVRTFAYSWLAKSQALSVDRLPHVAEDLAIEDASTRLDVVRSIGDGRSAALLVALRRVLEGAKGDLRSATLEKMAYVGRGDAAPDLLAELRGAPWQFATAWYRILEEGLGSEALARELIDLVKSDPTLLPLLARLLRNDRQYRGELSSATVNAVIQGLPHDFLTPEVVSAVAMQLNPATVKPIVLQLLASPRREDVVAAIQFASQLRIDAAWDTLAKLLETGDGEIKQKAIDALTALREYRELRRTVLADEGDARRVAMEKARELMKSGKPDQRAGAALALAATADVAAIPLLLDLLGDADASVRAAAKLALEKLAERAPASAPAEAPKKDDGKKKAGQ